MLFAIDLALEGEAASGQRLGLVEPALAAGQAGEQAHQLDRLRVPLAEQLGLHGERLAPEPLGAREIALLLRQRREVADRPRHRRVLGSEDAPPLLEDRLELPPRLGVLALAAEGDGEVGARGDRRRVLLAEQAHAHRDRLAQQRLGLVVATLLAQQRREIHHLDRDLRMELAVRLDPQRQRLAGQALRRHEVALLVSQQTQLVGRERLEGQRRLRMREQQLVRRDDVDLRGLQIASVAQCETELERHLDSPQVARLEPGLEDPHRFSITAHGLLVLALFPLEIGEMGQAHCHLEILGAELAGADRERLLQCRARRVGVAEPSVHPSHDVEHLRLHQRLTSDLCDPLDSPFEQAPRRRLGAQRHARVARLEQAEEEVDDLARLGGFVAGEIPLANGLGALHDESRRQDGGSHERRGAGTHGEPMPRHEPPQTIGPGGGARHDGPALPVATEVLGELGDGGVALCGVLAQRLHDDQVEVVAQQPGGDRGGTGPWRRGAAPLPSHGGRRSQRLRVADSALDLRRRLALEVVRSRSDQELVEHHAQRVDVGRGGDRPARAPARARRTAGS